MRPVVPHRPVLRAAIIPERDRVFGPAKAALEQRAFRMVIKIGQDRVALVSGNAEDVAGKNAGYIKSPLFCGRGGGGPRGAGAGGGRAGGGGPNLGEAPAE